MDKVVVILGPTGSGKSKLAFDMARKFDGEIINADTRAFYKGMDIGTSKPTKKMQRSVKYHLVDVASPRSTLTLQKFIKLAKSSISKIQKSGRLPIVEGGSALFTKALVYNYQIPEIKADPKLRRSLEAKSNAELFDVLEGSDPLTARTIDRHNKRRLIRAIEVNIKTGKSFYGQRSQVLLPKNTLILGIQISEEKLKARIKKRAENTLSAGFVDEVKKLRANYSFELQAFSAIGYREVKDMQDGKIAHSETLEKIIAGTTKLSKHQKTWYKKNKDIVWVKNSKEAERKIKRFMR